MSRRLLWVFLGTLVATVLVAWLMVQFVLVRPANRELEVARAETVIFVAQAMREGASMEALEQELGVDLRMDGGDADGPPRPAPPGVEAPPTERPPTDAVEHWQASTRRGVTLWRREGPGWEVAAWTGDGWVVLHHDPLPMGLVLLGLLLLGGLPVALIGYRITSNAVRPVEAAEVSVARIAEGELSHRLDEEAGSRELRRMSRAVNGMAARIQRLVEGDRQRMAYLSHELRTPLTRARLELELARRAGVDVPRLERVETELEQLEKLVAELLELSRLELGGAEALRPEQVDLRGLAEVTVDEEQESGVEIDGEGEAYVDARLVRRALSNLLRNSRLHAPGARRWIRVEEGRLVVGDDGPGLPEEARAHMFDLFWRGPDGSQIGHGLGLAIVRQVAELHGGRVHIDGDDGFVVTLELPRAAPTAP